MSREMLLQSAAIGVRNLPVPVNQDFSEEVIFEDVDLSTATFAADVRSIPGDTGTVLESLTISSPDYDDADTSITLSISKAELVALASTVAGGDLVEETELFWDLQQILSGDVKIRLSGTFTLIPGVT